MWSLLQVSQYALVMLCLVVYSLVYMCVCLLLLEYYVNFMYNKTWIVSTQGKANLVYPLSKVLTIQGAFNGIA